MYKLSNGTDTAVWAHDEIVSLREQLAQQTDAVNAEYARLCGDIIELKGQLAQAQEQLETAKANGIREAILDYKNRQPMKAGNYYVVDALDCMNKYAYRLTNNTIDKGE